jgi:hypothetical protein
MKYSTPEIAQMRRRAASAENKPRKPSRRFRRLRLTALVVLCLIGFWFFNYGSPFIIREIRITTDKNLNSEKIYNDFNAGGLIGMNVFYIPLDEIKFSFLSDPKIKDVKITRWRPGILNISMTSAKPVYVLAKPWGYYFLGEDGNYIKTAPPYSKFEMPLKFRDERQLFDNQSRPRRQPWKEVLSNPDIDDATLMKALGYRDLLRLAVLITGETSKIKDVEYIGYDLNYGLVLKCRGKSLILLGYGNNLPAHFATVEKILTDPSFPHSRDKYVDLRFEEFYSMKLLDNLPPLFD